MKKELLIPILVAALTIAFGFVCFIMYFKKNNRRLTNWKMKLGALLLALNALGVGNLKANGGGIIQVCLLVPAHADKPIIMGPTFSYNYSNIFSKSLVDNTILKGSGYSFGLRYEYIISKNWVFPKHSILIKLEYEKLNGNSRESITDSNTAKNLVVNFNSSNPPNLSFTYDMSLNDVNLSLMYKIIFFKLAHVMLGPKLSYFVNNNLKEGIEVYGNGYELEKNNPMFTYESNTKAIVSNGKMHNMNKFGLSLPVGVGYSILIGGKWYIDFSAMYEFGLTSITKYFDTKVNSWTAGVGISFLIK